MELVELYNHEWHGGKSSWQAQEDSRKMAAQPMGAPVSTPIGAPVVTLEPLLASAILGTEGPAEEPSECFLTDDVWKLVFARLPVESLGSAAVVNRQWYRIVQDPAIWATSFAARWQLSALHGIPSSTSFWRLKMPQFALSHPLSRHDTVAGLAIKYDVQVVDIMRLNNMMSTHGIYSRQRLLIPVTKETELQGCEGQIVKDEYARREVVVVYPVGQKPDLMVSARADTGLESATERAHQERMRRKVLETLRRSLRVDDSTISYYLAEANGDVRLACKLCLEDLRWNRSVRPNRPRTIAER